MNLLNTAHPLTPGAYQLSVIERWVDEYINNLDWNTIQIITVPLKKVTLELT